MSEIQLEQPQEQKALALVDESSRITEIDLPAQLASAEQ